MQSNWQSVVLFVAAMYLPSIWTTAKREEEFVRSVSEGESKQPSSVKAEVTTPSLTSLSTAAPDTHTEEVQMGCHELRSKKYISDGFCTSAKPLSEVVCAGHCLPIKKLPWYAQVQKIWATYKTKQWRCVNDKVRRKKVTLICENGERRSYKIKIVRSCKCKKYHRRHNMTRTAKRRKSRRDAKRRRRRRLSEKASHGQGE